MSLILRNLSKHYPGVRAVDDVTLELPAGQVLALLGPSGSGKSTLLRLIAGLEQPDSGSVSRGGQDLTRLAPQRRSFGMVFQDYALFPHLDVAGNVAFALVEQRWPRERQAARVAELLALVGLEGYERRRVQQLSGGQQQRVALARALAVEPDLLLFDEPLSNLDAALRETLKREIAGLLRRLELTGVYVTHDQDEAFLIADLVGVLHRGRLVQLAPPAELLARPRDTWVARFLGYPNVFSAEQLRRAGLDSGSAALLNEGLVSVGAAGGPSGAEAVVREVTHEGQLLRLQLFVPAWQLDISWSGYPRELGAPPEQGDRVGLSWPQHAWVPLAADGGAA
jgi:ABC-type Fe3+/spermidine/putrescine transport system ATPase subunit